VPSRRPCRTPVFLPAVAPLLPGSGWSPGRTPPVARTVSAASASRGTATLRRLLMIGAQAALLRSKC
jgi:hypothetical protein